MAQQSCPPGVSTAPWVASHREGSLLQGGRPSVELGVVRSEKPEMIVKLTPASEDRRVWMVSISPDAKHDVPIDFMTAPQEQRHFLGEETAYFEAEPLAEGWEIKSRLDRQSW